MATLINREREVRVPPDKNKKGTRTIQFIRHGESEANIGLATSHTEDIQLTALGKIQAVSVANTFTKAPDLLISSPYMRSIETAEPTRLRFSVELKVWYDVREFTYLGSLHGINSTRQQRNIAARAFWDKCDPVYQDGNGESFKQFLCRVQSVMTKLQSRKERFIVVFTHEQFIRGVKYLNNEGFPRTFEEMQRSMKRFRHLLNNLPLSNGYEYNWEPRAWQDRQSSSSISSTYKYQQSPQYSWSCSSRQTVK